MLLRHTRQRVPQHVPRKNHLTKNLLHIKNLVEPNAIWGVAVCAWGRRLGVWRAVRIVARCPPHTPWRIETIHLHICLQCSPNGEELQSVRYGDVDPGMMYTQSKEPTSPYPAFCTKALLTMPVYPSPFPRSSASHSQDAAEVISRTDPSDRRDTTSFE